MPSAHAWIARPWCATGDGRSARKAEAPSPCRDRPPPVRCRRRSHTDHRISIWLPASHRHPRASGSSRPISRSTPRPALPFACPITARSATCCSRSFLSRSPARTAEVGEVSATTSIVMPGERRGAPELVVRSRRCAVQTSTPFASDAHDSSRSLASTVPDETAFSLACLGDR